MQRFTRKKIGAAAVTAALLIGGGGIAFAYFTASGGGTGTASVGSGPGQAFVITSDGPDTALTPGNGDQQFDVSIQNTSDQAAYVGTVSMAVLTDAGTGDAETPEGTDIAGCDASWFTVTPSLGVDTTVAVGDTVTASGLDLHLPSISMTDSGADQDACEGADIGIAFSA